MFGKDKSSSKKRMRIFFVTDIHGSDICFRKLCNSLDFYKVDELILGGDMTGKMVVPIVPSKAGRYESTFTGRQVELDGEQELKNFIKLVKDMGFYPKVMSKDEFTAIAASPEAQNKVFRQLISERLHDWSDYAASKLKGRGVKIYCAPGNDDETFVDEILEQSGIFELAEGRHLVLADGREMITCAWSNPTPWQTPRECSEKELESRLVSIVGQVKDFSTAIFNFHAPPYNSKLDECPALDKDLKVISQAGQPVFAPVGSTSVRKLIETNQPLLGLHGHIHEGKGTYTLGRTLCVNPGSCYNEGVLQGCILTLEGSKVINVQFTSG